MNELLRALRHVDLNELADAVDQCYQQDVELSDLPTKFPKPVADDDDEAGAASAGGDGGGTGEHSAATVVESTTQ